jgi:hypothetical protein
MIQKCVADGGSIAKRLDARAFVGAPSVKSKRRVCELKKTPWASLSERSGAQGHETTADPATNERRVDER